MRMFGGLLPRKRWTGKGELLTAIVVLRARGKTAPDLTCPSSAEKSKTLRFSQLWVLESSSVRPWTHSLVPRTCDCWHIGVGEVQEIMGTDW
jgi:hypothetical protein